MAKHIRFPFADAGDRSAVADETDSGGVVTYQSGYPPQYSADLQSDPSARRLNRDRYNQILHDLSSNIQQWQRVLYPSFITPAENDGTAIPYRQGVVVDNGTINRVSLVDNNTADIANTANWANAIPWPLALGGTGATTAAAARVALGLGTSSTLNAGVANSDDVIRRSDGDARYAGISSTIPVGAISMWPTMGEPSGWLQIDGQTYSQQTYPELFALLGTTTLPDFRGEFMRGWDNGRGIDPGRTILTAQAEEFPAHTHSVVGSNTGSAGSGSAEGITTDVAGQTGSTGGTENRPRNISVMFIIKAERG